MSHDQWLWLIPALPLLGSLICGILHFSTLSARRENPEASGPSGLAPLVASGAVLGSFLVSVAAFFAITGDGAAGIETAPWRWIATGDFDIQVSMAVDRLSSVMILVVSGVGFLIHVYSAGYMKGDPGYAKFFAYLNLFVFAMLILVLSSNLLGLFIGWEGVGLCSYLLIGFWYEKGWPAEAGQKAFVVNRIGDACFLLGSFLLLQVFGTLDFSDLQASVQGAMDAHGTKLTWAALLLFGGAMGKSAQLPLFVWLPDAMAGPTPVSALIHAATMVTAGIYLIVRTNALYAAAPAVTLFIAVIGAVTALIAGSTALVQRDIKKVLAYSTVSQLGYMFLALGCGAWVAAIFHLVTHAFFKALLFLGAGSVIHGMHEEQDMHRMGGLRSHMPATYMTFLAGAGALSGLPLMSGFFSKDEILAHTFAHGGVYLALWIVGLITAAMTAFYTWRMVALTFFGPERFDAKKVHPHESPRLMTLPLWILAVPSVTAGILALPHVIAHSLHIPRFLEDWLAPVLAPGHAILAATHHESHAPSVPVELVLLGVGSVIALLFAHRGFYAYINGTARDEDFQRSKPELQGFLGRAWGIDRAYQEFVVQPVKLAAFGVSVFIDQFAIDGAVNGIASLAREGGRKLRGMATGDLKNYGLWMGASTLALAILWIWS